MTARPSPADFTRKLRDAFAFVWNGAAIWAVLARLVIGCISQAVSCGASEDSDDE